MLVRARLILETDLELPDLMPDSEEETEGDSEKVASLAGKLADALNDNPNLEPDGYRLTIAKDPNGPGKVATWANGEHAVYYTDGAWRPYVKDEVEEEV